jgi:hypothetical protein
VPREASEKIYQLEAIYITHIVIGRLKALNRVRFHEQTMRLLTEEEVNLRNYANAEDTGMLFSQ